jgi:hypothetical protein
VVIHARIDQALRELPLSDEDIAHIAPQIAENYLLQKGYIVSVRS